MKQASKPNRTLKHKNYFVISLLLVFFASTYSYGQSETKNQKNTMVADSKSASEKKNILFEKIDQPPIFPGCEGLEAGVLKNCMAQKITRYVNAHFDTRVISKMEKVGRYRILVNFIINKKGKVVDVVAEASDPMLRQESIRVVSQLPDMIPGEEDGAPVNVRYTLPIIFQVQ